MPEESMPLDEPAVDQTDEVSEQPDSQSRANASDAMTGGDDVGGPDELLADENVQDDASQQKMLEELAKMEKSDGLNEPDVPEELDSRTAMFGDGYADTENDFAEVKPADFQQLKATSGGHSIQNLDLLMDVTLPISIELGRTSMNIQEILNLGPGSIVELNKLAGEPVDLLVNNKIVARGEVVVLDENFGIRVTSLVSPEERLRSLGE